ncbi:MAG: M3 family metallopeptidase [Betaproteobacteria bacterium]
MTTSDGAPLSPDALALLAPWPGPCGGLPPYDRATPAALAEALPHAVAERRRAVRAIAGNPEPPSFANTVEALEDSARPLRDLHALSMSVATTASVGDMPAVAQRLAPLVPALDLEVAHDRTLFARVEAVWQTRQATGLDAQQQRLVEVLRGRLLRAGAALGDASQARLKDIDARIAVLQSCFNQNLLAEQAGQLTWFTDAAELDGLPPAQQETAAAAARARGREGAWALPNQRPAGWPFLQNARRRASREAVWRLWNGRGGRDGPSDNRPLIAEILQLRGERARLLGHPSHAHAVLADRMAGHPDTALAVLQRTWSVVRAATQRQLTDYQAIADAEADAAGLPRHALAPWDRLYCAEQVRRQRFAVEGGEVAAYLPLQGLLQAMFWAAGRVHGLAFTELHGVPVLHPSVRVFEVRRAGEAIGALYADLFQRPGKAHGSHQARLRAAEHGARRVLPISVIVSGVPEPAPGQPALLPWEYANVLFHEFGHALHMLLDGARYPSLGSLNVAWDLVELPSLLNEYWLRDRELLRRFARHHATGEPMPEALIERLEAALRYDRIFRVNLDFLGSAIVDLRLHLLADGSGQPIDAVAVERQVLQELGMPACWDLVLHVTHSVHSFAGGYDAGVYAYLWSDVMAADVGERFLAAPGGLYDAEVARAWRDSVLSVGHTVPADAAFRTLMGRDPDPAALLRRFALA